MNIQENKELSSEEGQLHSKEIDTNQHKELEIKSKVKNKNSKSELLDFYNKNIKPILKNPYTLTFLIILTFGVYLRIKYFYVESIWNDAAVHLWFAQKVLIEPSFFFSSQYLFGDYFLVQTLVSGLFIFIKDIFISAKIIALLFSILGITSIYLIGKDLKNKTTGLISAFLLSTHHLLWFYDTRVLADAPLASMFIFSLYSLIKLEKEKTKLWGIISGLSIISMLLIKKQAIIFPIALFIYYLFKHRKEMFTKKSILYSWLIAFATPMIGAIFLSLFTGENILKTLFINKLIALEGIGSSTSVINQLSWIYSWPIIIGTILGLIIIFSLKMKKYYLPITLTLIYAIWFEIGISLPYDRYLLSIIPLGVLLTATTIDEIGNFAKLLLINKNYFKLLIIIPIILLISSPLYSDGTALIESKSYSYTGYQEAAEWVNSNAPKDSILYSGSPRPMRAFTAREYLKKSELGLENNPSGYLINLRDERLKQNKTLFIEEVENYHDQGYEIFLEIDSWEYTQANWYFPITQQSINVFEEIGFELVYVIDKPIPTNQGLQKNSVIFLFRYKGLENE